MQFSICLLNSRLWILYENIFLQHPIKSYHGRRVFKRAMSRCINNYIYKTKICKSTGELSCTTVIWWCEFCHYRLWALWKRQTQTDIFRIYNFFTVSGNTQMPLQFHQILAQKLRLLKQNVPENITLIFKISEQFSPYIIFLYAFLNDNVADKCRSLQEDWQSQFY